MPDAAVCGTGRRRGVEAVECCGHTTQIRMTCSNPAIRTLPPGPLPEGRFSGVGEA